MQVKFLGAAQRVTGSMHLVQCGRFRVLLDCGLFQGKRSEAYDINRKLPFPAAQIDAVILSHAHIDHSGNLPSLVRQGFRGKIYATSATRELSSTLLFDTARLQENDLKYVNKRRRQNQEPEFNPLYREEDVVKTIRAFRVRDYEEPFEVVPGVTATFFNSGHMLGAASVQLSCAETKQTLVFSGDIGRYQDPMLCAPQVVPGANYVIMEATYGDRLHQDDVDAEQQLHELCQNVWKKRGSILIPAFSIGRTQHLVYLLNTLAENDRLPPFKVFVDSPMAVDATEVYRSHVECFNEEFIQSILKEEDRDPLGFRNLYYVRSSEHSKAINQMNEPLIIISASGMLEGGRILHHLKQRIDDPKTTVVFAGYQAENTLGRRILEGAEFVKIFGVEYPVYCQTMRLDSVSGHADQSELIRWAKAVQEAGSIKQIAFTHCELEPAQTLKQEFERNGLPPVLIPARGDYMNMES
ncbi:MAG: MBL fold metallo-hydrolase [Planctomycetaceae bacterium]|nr:MBL fold metallo-hydrolase [Planctomycetaceae bacterium]